MIVAGYDIETTGLKYEDGHRIIEMAVSLYRTEDGVSFKKMGNWVRRVNPQRSIDAMAQAVHGITPADLRKEPVWKEVAPQLIKILKAADLVVAHNGESFDFPFTAYELMNAGFEVPDFEIYDTMTQNRNSTAMGKVPSLKEFCWSMGVEYDDTKAHAALYDVEVMMEAFFIALRRGRADVPLLTDLRVAY